MTAGRGKGKLRPAVACREEGKMNKTEPVTFREKLAMFLMRQAYIWIEKIDRKAVPKASPFYAHF